MSQASDDWILFKGDSGSDGREAREEDHNNKLSKLKPCKGMISSFCTRPKEIIMTSSAIRCSAISSIITRFKNITTIWGQADT